jgi:DNA-binding NarL/FixJ family response regulator
MPGSGFEAATQISRRCPVTRIVFLTASDDEDHLMKGLKAGGRGYILKGVAARELVQILRSVNAGESYVPPGLAASLLLEMHEPKPERGASGLIDELTTREREILELLAGGMSNKEIGAQLFLSEKTVKHYMTNILQKLQVRNRVEAALLAQKAARD